MARKKKAQEDKGSSGGSAAAGGVGFQQSVAAYALAHVLVGDTSLQAFGLDREFDFSTLHVESALAIDDVVIIGRSHRALIQAKTTVSMSSSENSTYADVLRQFVNHHVREGREGDAYILATSIQSSSRIVLDLTRLVESARLSASALEDNPLTQAEEEVLKNTRTLILAFLADAGIGSPSEDDFLGVFRRMHVLPLDFEAPRGRDLNSALMLLRGKALIESQLLWSTLLQLCSALATDRGSIDKAGLMSRLGHNVNREGVAKTLLDEATLEVLTPEDPSVGKDLVAFYAPGKENTRIIVAASPRFDNDGSKITKFTRDGVKYRDGTVQPIIFRSATLKGAVRFLAENQNLKGDREVVIIENWMKESFESNTWSKAHKSFLRTSFEISSNKLICLVCGNPVSEDRAHVVEIDEEGLAPAAGITHKRCQYPGLRILGELQSPLFAYYKALRDFDFNRWIAAAQKGHSVLTTSVVQGVATVLWNSRLPGHPRGSWCVKIDTNDGGSHYVSNRGKVLRFSEELAQGEAADFQQWIEEAAAAGDPLCVSEDRQYFAQQSLLLEKLARGTTILQCVGASEMPFNRAIDRAYSTAAEYYAPVVLLVVPERGDPVELAGAIVVLTNPLKILVFLENWREAGFDVPSIAAEVIETDEKFDRIVGDAIGAEYRVLVDPLFDGSGNLVSGLEMVENLHARA